MNDDPIDFGRPFVLQRDRDISGVSGTGIVADGIVFPDGHAAIHWRGKWALTTPHPDGLESILAIHDHGGQGDLHVIWADHDQLRQKTLADVVDAFDLPSDMCGPVAERAHLYRQVERGIQKVQDGQAAPVEVGDVRIVEAVMPVIDRILKRRDRWRNTVGRAYRLAHRWENAHGSSSFLVKAAGAELRDELDDSEAAAADVAHPKANAQASHSDGVDESTLRCVCGDPVTWMDHITEPGWIHAPGSDTKCLNARPRCPECQMPHLVVPGQPPMCRAILAHLKQEDPTAPAAECSAQYYKANFGPARQCIRAAQHRGDHIDEHGFHWSDTVAIYPADIGPETAAMPFNFDVPALHGAIQFRATEPEPQHGKAYASSCSNPDHACDTCGECVRQHPGEGGCFDSDQTPPNQGPLTGVEVRDPCPHCEGCPLIPRRQMILHLREQHPGAVCDFPLGWRVAKAYTLDEHNPNCSYARTRGALLCDCHILYPEPQPDVTLASHDNGPRAATEVTEDPADGTARTPRQRAYKAVSEYLLTLGWHSLATRSQIWRAVNRALEAAGHTSDPETLCQLPHEMEA
ncbi:hypothetical protein ACIRJO_02720 [Streptomyces sp. NPDC102394]|uniref:hypothetical protein n=1 Tax=Streptomyces sp. NPDC102394 TaxID=3366167 RepID=UPI0037F41717